MNLLLERVRSARLRIPAHAGDATGRCSAVRFPQALSSLEPEIWLKRRFSVVQEVRSQTCLAVSNDVGSQPTGDDVDARTGEVVEKERDDRAEPRVVPEELRIRARLGTRPNHHPTECGCRGRP